MIIDQDVVSTYLGLDTRTNQECVIKVLPDFPSDVDVENVREHFSTLATIKHPNIVNYLEAIEVEGRLVLAIELVSTITFEAAQHRGNMSESDAIRFIVAAAAGLQAAHERGIVHGEVMPSNLLLTEDEQVKVGGFEHSQIIAQAQQSNIDSDIRGLGESLAFCLTRQKLFAGESWRELIEIHQKNADTPNSKKQKLSTETLEIVFKMIGNDSKSEYQSLPAAINALERLLGE
jgi:serine/threonine protein kinase